MPYPRLLAGVGLAEAGFEVEEDPQLPGNPDDNTLNAFDDAVCRNTDRAIVRT